MVAYDVGGVTETLLHNTACRIDLIPCPQNMRTDD